MTNDHPYPINPRLQQFINATRAADPFAACPGVANDIDAVQTVPKDTEEQSINHDTQKP